MVSFHICLYGKPQHTKGLKKSTLFPQLDINASLQKTIYIKANKRKCGVGSFRKNTSTLYMGVNSMQKYTESLTYPKLSETPSASFDQP